LADGLPLFCIQRLDFTFDVVKLPDQGQCLLGHLALVGHVQIEELASRMSPAANLDDVRTEQAFVARRVTA